MTIRVNSVEENLRVWDSNYTWPQDGAEWSSDWGSPRFQWLISILPRINAYLPAGTILEIAPGHGRWTDFLKNECRRLIVVDLSPSCIEYCKRRFEGISHLEYHVNDGKSLAMVEDNSVDFVFSFDSLVHADADVLREYVRQLSRKLRPGGAAFLHHSHAGTYAALFGPMRRIAGLLGRVPTSYLHDHWRSLTMTAGLMRDFCGEAGLFCKLQEIVPFERTLLPIDCLTVLQRPAGQTPGTGGRFFKNMSYRREARAARRLWSYYELDAKRPRP